MNLALFMIVGYETTSSTLAYCTYILAKHPEEQQKLYDEISSFYENYEDVSFDLKIQRDFVNIEIWINFQSQTEPTIEDVDKLEYLDMFIKEVLRIYPIVNR